MFIEWSGYLPTSNPLAVWVLAVGGGGGGVPPSACTGGNPHDKTNKIYFDLLISNYGNILNERSANFGLCF